ncbi:uncharacterized protein LOC128222491 isoform X2 [Mya arenaria]|uniref:uncharacterized protein LOC128222491 isoform X2 n=1 Tax=Mya arenaria TaxID=6604 RepID=UPI0022E5C293|nr:uncharacterized protein LOC128222491 isoform X2 [Mya arenaria]
MKHGGPSVFYAKADGSEWAKYVNEKLKSYGIHGELNELSVDKHLVVVSQCINVLIITPDFLEHKDWSSISELDHDTCFAVLTGVELCDLKDAGKLYGCEHMAEWEVHENTGTDDCVKDMFVKIIAIYEHSNPLPSSHSPHSQHPPHTPAHGQKLPLRHIVSDPSSSFPYWNISSSPRHTSIGHLHEEDDDDRGYYDTLPQKPRQVNALKEVFFKDDVIYMIVERLPEEEIDVKIGEESVSPILTAHVVYTLPTLKGHPKSEVTVSQHGDVIGKRHVSCLHSTPEEAFDADVQNAQKRLTSLSGTSKSIATQTDVVQMETPRKSQVQTPEGHLTDRESEYMTTSAIRLRSSSQNSCDSKLEQLCQLLEEETSPETLLCRCLGIEQDTELLDKKMAKLVDTMETLRAISFPSRPLSSEATENSTWPTLVHFGARFNLQTFCDVLLSNPIFYDACTRKNSYGDTPEDIARKHGHRDLAAKLEAFAQELKSTKYDSGVSGFSLDRPMPRLSTILLGDAPPPPHAFQRYINLDGDTYEERKPELPPRPFEDLYDISADSEFADKRGSGSSVSSHEHGGIDDVQYKHKDVTAMLGCDSPSPQEEKKKKHWYKRLLSKTGRERSNSEPAITVLRDFKGSRKDHSRSSGSSSSASTYSDGPGTVPYMDEQEEVTLRESVTKNKGKGKIKGILMDKKHLKRQSMRIKKAEKDSHHDGPKLPLRAQELKNSRF